MTLSNLAIRTRGGKARNIVDSAVSFEEAVQMETPNRDGVVSH